MIVNLPRLAGLMTAALILAGCTGAPKEGAGGEDANASGAPTGDGATGTTTTADLPGPGVDSPALSVGDQWVERTVTGGPYPSDVTTTRKVLEKDVSLVVGSTTHTTYKLEVTSAGSTTSQWLRMSDLAAVKTYTESQYAKVTTTYETPCATDWPIAVGKSWTTTCGFSTQTETSYGNTPSTGTKTETYEVVSMESVTVPAGTFDTYKITFTSGSTTGTQWYAAEACTPAKTTQTTNGTETTLTLESYVCAAP